MANSSACRSPRLAVRHRPRADPDAPGRPFAGVVGEVADHVLEILPLAAEASDLATGAYVLRMRRDRARLGSILKFRNWLEREAQRDEPSRAR